MYRETKLKELLKTGRAKCIFDSGMLYLTKGKSYNVWGEYDSVNILVIDDSNMAVPYPLSYFEPVLNNDVSKSNSEIDISLDSVDDVNTTFKVGDKVYKYGEIDVKTVLEVFEDGYMRISNYPHMVNHECICHATQENYEMLCKLYPHIEFELSPKPLKGSDLTKIMFERGDFAVVCKCSNIGECSAIASSTLRLVIEYDNGRFLDNTGHLWDFAVPYNPKTNLPLTEEYSK